MSVSVGGSCLVQYLCLYLLYNQVHSFYFRFFLIIRKRKNYLTLKIYADNKMSEAKILKFVLD